MNTSDTTATKPAARSAWIIAAIVAVCVALRLGVALLDPDKLLVDTDAYLAYANAWTETGTFGYEGRPTAYRPPAYPWLLSLFGPPTAAWVATINVLSGTGTVLFVWLTARRLQFSLIASSLAALLVAIDPLLVQYAGQAMTESLCTFESALLFWLIANAGLFPLNGSTDTAGQGRAAWFALAAGVVGGLSVLTRPTFLVFGVLLVATLSIRCLMSLRNGHSPPFPPPASYVAEEHRLRGRGSQGFLPLVLLVAGAAMPVGAWGVRNQLLLGTPVITTTHGGYTLLLGNNETYYREVIGPSFTTEWEGVSAWAEELNRSLDDKELQTEVERDRAMRDEALQTIRREPATFARACLLRFLNFWAVVPGGDARAGLPAALVIGIGAFYIIWWLVSAAGVVQAVRTKAISLIPAACLIAAFVSVHIVYWSNARMRAPVLPALALLAAYCLFQRAGTASTRSVDRDRIT